jgi:hypothetical protein
VEQNLIQIEALPWQGGGVYTLDGAGVTMYNPQQDMYFVGPVPLRNPSPFLGGHRVCRYTAYEDGANRGVFAIDCLGPPGIAGSGSSIFAAGGRVARIPCPEVVPSSVAEFRAMTGRAPRYFFGQGTAR